MEKPSLRGFLQFFRDIPGTFSGSVREFSRLSNLIGAAMVLALSVVLSYFSIRIPPFKIGFAYLATAMLGMLFGPVMGGAAAGLGDIIKYFITPSDGAFFPGYTLSAILGGVIYGIFFYKNKTSVTRCILAKFCVNFFINILLGTYWYSIVYGKAFWAILGPRILKNLAMLPVEILILYLVLSAMVRLLPRVGSRFTAPPPKKVRR
mgnify:CR=1 FL=1